MSKPIKLRDIPPESWYHYLAECHEVDVESNEELLEVFMSSKELIRGAVALRDKRRATERGRVVEINRR